jgi:hypothetical protein
MRLRSIPTIRLSADTGAVDDVMLSQFAGELVAGESYKEVDVRKLLTVAVAVAALSAFSSSPAFATGKNPPTSCGVGSAVRKKPKGSVASVRPPMNSVSATSAKSSNRSTK